MKKFLSIMLASSLAVLALEPILIEDCGKPDAWKLQGGTTCAAAEGPEGTPAITFSGLRTATRALPFSDSELNQWDQYQGISFYAKGDGSDVWAPIAIQNRYTTYSYLYFIPLKSTEWTKYTIAWKQFIPESMVDLIQTPGGMPPCGINSFRVGCHWTIWYDNAPIPKHSLSLAKVMLEPVVNTDNTSFQPAPFQNFLSKLKERKHVLIQCQGDSITAGTGVPNKEQLRYSIKLEEALRSWLKTDQIDVLNRAVGGAKVNDMRAWLDRDFSGAVPDLVTIWCGYNDKSGGTPVETYKKNMADYIDRICSKTRGETAILLFATGPGSGARFAMMDDYAQAMRDLASEKGIPCFDVHRLFKSFPKLEFGSTYMTDTAHPNAKGHALIADALAEYLVKAAGITDPRPLPPPKPVVAPGKGMSWDFEKDCPAWKLERFAALVSDKAKDGQGAIRIIADGTQNDYPRAWSTPVNVAPGQKYRISADMINDAASGEARLYMVEYKEENGNGKYNPNLTHIATASSMNWNNYGKEYEVPENVASVKVLLWCTKDFKGTVHLDNVNIKAVQP